MLCPECSSEMLLVEFNSVDIDCCMKCGGVWLDEGELELLIPAKEGRHNPIPEIVSHSRRPVSKGSSRRCPVCRKRMAPAALAPEPDVEIDKCPLNQGLWFDRGELERILAGPEPGGKIAEHLRAVFKKNNVEK